MLIKPTLVTSADTDSETESLVDWIEDCKTLKVRLNPSKFSWN